MPTSRFSLHSEGSLVRLTYSMTSPEPAVLPFRYQLIAGAIAGVSEISTLYPLDVVKTRFQQQLLTTSKSAQYHGVIDCFKRIISEEGVGRLYRGMLSPVIVEAPKRAMKFASQQEFSKIARELTKDNPNASKQLASVITGICTGITEAMIVSSFELVKIRMQDRSNIGLYASTGDCARKILAQEGPVAFLRGLESAMWRNGSWNGAYFGMIHGIRTNLPLMKTKNKKTAETIRNFVAGTLGGILATTANTPFDVVKTRIQSFIPSPGVQPEYRWAIPGVIKIAKEEGVRGLYRGYVPKVLRLGPGGGILLVVFDAVTSFLQKNKNLV